MIASVETFANETQHSHANSPRERDQALDALKGLAIIGVLFVHMNFTRRFSEATLASLGVIQQSLGWCVMAFFFCAGVLTRTEEYREPGQYILKRAKRLLVPCLVFSLTYKCAQLLIQRYSRFGQNGSEPPSNFLEWLEFLFVPVGPQFYFLPYLFVVSLFSAVLIDRFKATPLLAWIVCVACLAFYAIHPPPVASHGPNWILIPGYLFSFWLGLMARQKRSEHRVWWFVVVLSVLLGCVLRKERD